LHIFLFAAKERKEKNAIILCCELL